MVKQNYLDIYPSSGIAQQFKLDKMICPEAVAELFAEISDFIQNAEQENLQYLQERQNPAVSSGDSLRFFRSQERTRNMRLVLQYLMTFYEDLPLEADIDKKLVNPFEQIKSFAEFSVNLLKEADVSSAILREHERLGLLNETNAWYYRGQINKSYKQVMDVLERAHNATCANYCKIFEALHRLSLFWFSVRNETIKRVRRSDLLIFRMTLLLMHKHGCAELG